LNVKKIDITPKRGLNIRNHGDFIMGKIFPLKEKPSCFRPALKLIEASFHYQKENSFKIDFSPLMDPSNHHNCYVYLDDQEQVLAHVGARDLFINLNGKHHRITLLGGIAVHEACRGQGIFQELFTHVLSEKRSETAFFLLWSDQEKLYGKFGFTLCGIQIEASISPRENSPFIKTKLADLSEDDKKQIRDLYVSSFKEAYITIERSDTDWKMIEEITSADLYLQKERGLISSYYFMNKGQDLPGIIYEYGTKGKLENYLKELSHYGKVWLGQSYLESPHHQYQFFLAPADSRLFSDFIYDFTHQIIRIQKINPMKQEVFFDYDEETLLLEMPEFLRGVFGPGTFEELNLKPFFISGLDSI
jgi:predicted N-acetyltransferase YhbS